MFFEEYLEYEMITIFHYEDISRKQPHRVIFDPLMHLRVKNVVSVKKLIRPDYITDFSVM